MAGVMSLRVWDVEHGACAMLRHGIDNQWGRLAMIDSGHSPFWKPSRHIRNVLGRTRLDYLFITNADQDHMSDLDGLWDEKIHVSTLHRNTRITPEQLRAIKEAGGPLTNDIERYLQIHKGYVIPATEPFNDHMGGITVNTFGNGFQEFSDTNNLSLAVFVTFGPFKMLFPGDLEKAGWRALLKASDFVEQLKQTTILCASHHGRQNGFCEEVFEHLKPRAVVISDKPIAHETQLMVPDYRNVLQGDGVTVVGADRKRHVLTTRRDGHITFLVGDSNFWIETEV